MPYKPLKPCKYSGCVNLTPKSYCEQHRRIYGENRLSAAKRGYGYKWRIAANKFLRLNPICRCGNQAECVDHIVPHRGNKILFWDKSNWQALCKECHNRKTAKHDGGFGNEKYSHR